jgi:hypothetical protein
MNIWKLGLKSIVNFLKSLKLDQYNVSSKYDTSSTSQWFILYKKWTLPCQARYVSYRVIFLVTCVS